MRRFLEQVRTSVKKRPRNRPVNEQKRPTDTVEQENVSSSNGPHQILQRGGVGAAAAVGGRGTVLTQQFLREARKGKGTGRECKSGRKKRGGGEVQMTWGGGGAGVGR
jgi:hypothetical protein